MNKTHVIEIPVKSLLKAEWNYKTEGTPEQVAKISASIKHDKSAGVLAVREIKKKGRLYYEVIDGNHRLQAVKQLKWEKAHCENFGEITQAQAILIARRRNHVWFQDDVLKYAELFKNIVLPEYSLDDLETFMPEAREELEHYAKLLDFDWSQYEKSDQEDDEMQRTISIKVSETTFERWRALKEHVQKQIADEAALFDFLVRSALKKPKSAFT